MAQSQYTANSSLKLDSILVKVAAALQREQRWRLEANADVSFRSESKIPLTKSVKVVGTIGDKQFDHNVDVLVELTLGSDDQITWYPEYTIEGEIYLEGGPIKDLDCSLDADTSFSENDVNDFHKVSEAAQRINQYVENHVQHEFETYVNLNVDVIEDFKKTGRQEPEDKVV